MTALNRYATTTQGHASRIMVVEVEEEGLVLATFLLLASVDDGACGSDGLGEVALLVHVLYFVEGADGLPADE